MKKLILTLTTILFFVNENFAQQYVQTTKIIDLPQYRSYSRYLGVSLYLQDNEIFVGTGNNVQGTNDFPNYFVSLDANGRVANQTTVLQNTDWFGGAGVFNVNVRAISDQSNNYTGSVLTYEKDGNGDWTFKQRVQPNDPADNMCFGYSIALTDNQLIASALVNEFYNPNPCALYVFEKDGSGNWQQIQKITETDYPIADRKYLGAAVAVYGDYMVVSSTKIAFVYKKNGLGQWIKQQEIKTPDYGNTNSGSNIGDVAIHDNYIVIGNTYSPSNGEIWGGAVHIYKKGAGETWTLQQKITQSDAQQNNRFGEKVAIFQDRLVASANEHSLDNKGANPLTYAGAVYVFEKDNAENWSQIQKLVPSDRRVNDGFGYELAINNDYIVVHSNNSNNVSGVPNPAYPQAGSVYVFKNIASAGLPETEAEDAQSLGEISEWLFKSVDNKPILTLAVSGAQPLTENYTEVKVWKNASEQLHIGKLYLSRNYQIKPQFNATTSTGTITMYFDQQEFIAFNTNPAKTADFPISPDDLQGIANLRILKISGSSSNGSGLINTYSGTHTVINPDDDKIIWNAAQNRWEVTFDVTGFSGFFATTEPSVLPVKLLSFDVKKELNYAKLQWQTASETNNKGFEIYRSGDDKVFVKLDNVSASQSSSLSSFFYAFIDRTPLKGNNYYKLVQVDNDGTSTELGTRTVNFSFSKSSTQLHPNPTTNKVTATFTAGNFKKAVVTDVNGKTLMKFVVAPTDSELHFELGKLPSATYLIHLIGKETQIQRIIKL